jgi:NTP pyrophosphatase (non-canonical NTP hydrolase)
MLSDYGERFTHEVIRLLSTHVHRTAEEKGWWDKDPRDGTLIALMHSELSKLLEALRIGDRPSEHIPDYTAAEEEAADVVIQMLDMSAAREWRLAGAIVAKMRYNETRPHKHGGKKF